MHATSEASVPYHSLSRPGLTKSRRYGCYCGRHPRTAVYIFSRPSLPILFAKVLILFSQTLGTPSFSSFCLLPVNIRKRFVTSYVKHRARNYIYISTRVQIGVRSLLHLLSTLLILLCQQRTRAEEHKEQHPFPAKSFAPFNQKDIHPKHHPRRCKDATKLLQHLPNDPRRRRAPSTESLNLPCRNRPCRIWP